jgi:hypothetical protein
MAVVRICAGCQQEDDHPRHVFAVGGGQTPPMPWHMDCHVLATGCDTCAEQLAKCDTDPSNDGIKGAELRERLIALRSAVTETRHHIEHPRTDSQEG